MENAVEALEMAFAAFVFSIALSIAMIGFNQCRSTADTILTINDKTSSYEYVDINEENANSGDRIVGFETILPTIYKYKKEQFAVTILDTNGNPIVRFDTWSEGFMNNWDDILKDKERDQKTMNKYNEYRSRIEGLDNELRAQGENSNIWSGFEANGGTGNLYRVKRTDNDSVRKTTVSAQWGSEDEEIIKRIRVDIAGGKYTRNHIEYTGVNLNQYKNKQFKEKFIEIETSGIQVTEDDTTVETVKGNKKLEIIYIMQ